MRRSVQWYLLRLLICIPLLSMFAVVIMMLTCDLDSRPNPKCPRDADGHRDNLMRTPDGQDIAKAAKPFSAFLVILVMSGPKLQAGRQVLRDTWLTLRTSDILIRFVIGTADLPEEHLEILKKEQERYGDLLFLPNLKDAFSALTDKLIEMLVWLDSNVQYSFLLKVDDDSFVRLDAIMTELQQKNRERFFWGFFDGRARVHKAGKYAEKDWVLCDRYLPYAKGGGYILSSDLVHFVSMNAKYLKKYNGEDVSLGSWLAAVEVDRVHEPRFDTEYLSRGCSNSYLITHKQSPEDMAKKWELYKQTGHICEREIQLRPSYIYDWKKPPTECCKRENGIP